MSLVELFCHVDDFGQAFEPFWKRYMLSDGKRERWRETDLCASEIMTLVIHYHQLDFKHFKGYYKYVRNHLHAEFPKLVSYERFVALKKRIGVALYVYLYQCLGDCTGISYIDSTALPVCHNRRIYQHRVFEGLAERGQTSLGWFYGFKLHLVINHKGELLAFDLTAGNVHDSSMLEHLDPSLFGKLFGDKGYLSQAKTQQLARQGLDLVTSIRRNMKQLIMKLEDKILLRKRGIVESVNNLLKNWANISHSRHRDPNNFFVNVMAGLIAYCWKPDKPRISLDADENTLLNYTPRLA